jgi:hypothetical protein
MFVIYAIYYCSQYCLGVLIIFFFIQTLVWRAKRWLNVLCLCSWVLGIQAYNHSNKPHWCDDTVLSSDMIHTSVDIPPRIYHHHILSYKRHSFFYIAWKIFNVFEFQLNTYINKSNWRTGHITDYLKIGIEIFSNFSILVIIWYGNICHGFPKIRYT